MQRFARRSCLIPCSAIGPPTPKPTIQPLWEKEGKMSATRSSFRTSAAIAAAVIAGLASAGSPALGQTRAFNSPTTAIASASDEAQRLFDTGHWKEARNAYERATADAIAHREYAK